MARDWFGTGVVCDCGQPGCVYSTPEARQRADAAYRVAMLDAICPRKQPGLRHWLLRRWIGGCWR